MRNRANFVVVYRTGGTERGQWHRGARMVYAEAMDALTAVDRMGYKAMVVGYAESMLAGPLEGWEAMWRGGNLFV